MIGLSVGLTALTGARKRTLIAVVTNNSATTVSVYKWTGTAWASCGDAVAVGAAPFDCAISSDGQHVAVTTFGDSRVRILKWNGTTLEAATDPTATGGTGTAGVCWGADGAALYVTNYASNTFAAGRYSGGAVTFATPVGIGVAPTSVDVLGTQALVACSTSGGVSPLTFNGTVWESGSLVATGAAASDARFVSSTEALTANAGAGTVSRLLKTAGWAKSADVAVSGQPYGITVLADKSRAVSASAVSGNVNPLTLSGGAWGAGVDISVGAHCWHAALDSSARYGLAIKSDTAQVITLSKSGSTFAAGAALSTGAGPRRVAIGYVWG